MDIILYTCNSERNKIYKSLSNANVMSGAVREGTSIVNPVIRVVQNPVSYDYAYIPLFARYYYFIDIVSVRNNVWEITLACDPLMSFADDIVNAKVLLEASETTDASDYLSSDIWKSLVKSKTDILSFPDGLNDTGEYILITSGGVVS